MKQYNIMYIYPEWRCVDDNPIDEHRLHYSRFVLSPLLAGQGMILGVAMRAVLLSQVEGIMIISAKILNVTHEYSTIEGVKESVYEILINLKQIILKGNINKIANASISVKGPGMVTARHINLPSSIIAIDLDQHIAILTKEIRLDIELIISENKQKVNTNSDVFFDIDAKSSPLHKVNYSIYSFGKAEKKKEMLFLEIWTNKSLTPKEALYKAYNSMLDLFTKTLPGKSLINIANDNNVDLIVNINNSSANILGNSKNINHMDEIKNISIDKLALSPKIYHSLRRENIYTISDLSRYTPEDLFKMKNLGKKSVEQILLAVKERFNLNLFKQE